MALRWWGGRTQGGRHSADPGNGLPLVARLAGEELGRASRDKVEIGDRRVAMDRFVELCRGFGVVLDPATDGLDQLVGDGNRQRDPGLPSGRIVRRRAIRSQAYPPYSFAPNRVLLLHAERSAAGARSRTAADPRAERQRTLRMHLRRERFDACEIDFMGPGGPEVVRVIFATTMVLRDAVRSRVRKHPTRPFGVSYREVFDRYKAITASLVVESFEAV